MNICRTFADPVAAHQWEDRGASPGTIRRPKATLSIMLACAVEDSAIGVRYVPSEAAKRRHAKRKSRALTVEDVGKILGAMEESWRAFFGLLTQTGLRVGEALGLTGGRSVRVEDRDAAW